jgi:5-methylcytosine-specific restriction protein A
MTRSRKPAVPTMRAGAAVRTITTASIVTVRPMQSELDVASGERAALHATGRWRRLRIMQLSRYPLCQLCEAQGITVAASVADHRLGHGRVPGYGSAGGDWRSRFWDLALLQSLCATCHNEKSARELADHRRAGGSGA